MVACRPHTSNLDECTSTYESLFFPPNLPLSTTIEIPSHPIIDAVRDARFSTLPKGDHLVAAGDTLKIVPKGGRTTPPPRLIDKWRRTPCSVPGRSADHLQP